MVILAPALFLFAFGLAVATIATMLSTHGGKMMIALRMDCGLSQTPMMPAPVRPRRQVLASPRPIYPSPTAGALCAA